MAIELTNENYFSPEAMRDYWSCSQFKSFIKCEAEAMASMNGLLPERKTKALMIGSYVDAYFSGELDEFTANHPEIFNSRTGELKADFKQAEALILRAERDETFMEFMGGKPQEIMIGEIFGESFKIKMDSYFPGDKIVDLKCMKDMSPVWKDGERKTFIDAWGYDLQGFIYQQVVKFVTGKELPFYLAVITKEEHPDIAIIHIPQWKLNSAGEIIKHYLPLFSDVKSGNVEPRRCGKCGFCRDTKKIDRVIEYEDLLEE